LFFENLVKAKIGYLVLVAVLDTIKIPVNCYVIFFGGGEK